MDVYIFTGGRLLWLRGSVANWYFFDTVVCLAVYHIHIWADYVVHLISVHPVLFTGITGACSAAWVPVTESKTRMMHTNTQK
jgi:hypothetical protein